MAHAAKRYLAWSSLLAVVLTVLFACGGGGGGGGGGALTGNLLGTVTDATQAAVSGATVTVYDGTGATVATATTDAAGRFGINITTVGDYIVSAESAPAYFPAGRAVSIVNSRVTLADINLTSTRDRATQTVGSSAVDSTVGATVDSDTYIGATDRASLTIAADTLETAPATLYGGTATVYVAPVDTTKMDSGFAAFQFVLPAAVGDPVPAGSVLKIYAASGVAVVDAGSNGLITEAASPMTLSMPIPADPASLRATAPATSTLWQYNPVDDSWYEAGTAALNLGGTGYDADITEGGVYAVGDTATATTVTGTLQYSDASPAGGVSVIVTAGDATYRNVTTTSGTGAFSVLVEDGMTADLEFVNWGYGVQQTANQAVNLAVDNPALGTILLADIAAPTGSAANAIIYLDGSSSTGFIPSSGRFYVDPDSVLNTAEVADVIFVASLSNPDYGGAATVTVESGKLGATLINGAASNSVRVDNAFPASISVQTTDGHSASITVGSVSWNGSAWVVAVKSSFAL